VSDTYTLPRPLEMSYDQLTDIATIGGVKYSGALFRHFSLETAPGRWMRVKSREDGVITVEISTPSLLASEAIAGWIDKHQQCCEGCGHRLIDVTATGDLQMESHALDAAEEGGCAVCAVCLIADDRLSSLGTPAAAVREVRG
jgi:hypothetical protein